MPDSSPGVSSDRLLRREMIFQRERWYHRLLHNETALAMEKWLRLSLLDGPGRYTPFARF
jgi:hypothetical protein